MTELDLTLPERDMNLTELDKNSFQNSCLTEKVVILLGHDGPDKIPRSTILLNRRTELLQKCRQKRKFTYAGFKTRKWTTNALEI